LRFEGRTEQRGLQRFKTLPESALFDPAFFASVGLRLSFANPPGIERARNRNTERRLVSADVTDFSVPRFIQPSMDHQEDETRWKLDSRELGTE
jgi:hypothetical protein